jgi:hypothetical protein
MSRGYFVEQTRTFRASAEQCIEMLEQGKRAGTTQRKIALDTIVAIRSDARTGRLQIRTLNGTHQLDPVSYDEADVLRQIAIELELRMPPGGAEFLPLTDSREWGARRNDNAEERRALVSLENARAEDIPDDYQGPEYRNDVGTAELDGDPGHFTEQELHRLAQSLVVETDLPEPDNLDQAGPELPHDITVVGGVEITYQPEPTADPSVTDVDPRPTTHDSSLAPAATEAPSWVADPDDFDDSPIHMSQQAGDPVGAETSTGEAATGAKPADIGASEGGFSSRYGRLSHRALRHHIETGTQLPQTAAEPADTASSVFAAPTDPADTSDPTDTGQAPLSTPGPIEDRRRVDDPNFPSVFDRRGAVQSAHANGAFRFGDDLPVDHSFSHHDKARTEAADSDASESDRPAGPQTVSAPADPPPEGIGGTVGFNADFDVNPFR